VNERAGYDAATWKLVRPFPDQIATPEDVEGATAVFALSDTVNPQLIQTPKPQPVIWYADEQFAALLVQAESHHTEEGDEMRVAGLLLPSGATAVALMEDVEAVEDSDPVWLSLLEAEEDFGDDADDDDEDGEWTTFAAANDDDDDDDEEDEE
jgi:hypothetical protein